MSRRQDGRKTTELDRLAELAGEASAEAAYAIEHASPPEPVDEGAVPLDLTAAAFFDVDNTMMMGASIFHFARGLAARKFFTNSDLARFALQQVKFRVAGKESQDGIRTSREQALSFVAGHTVEERTGVQIGQCVCRGAFARRRRSPAGICRNSGIKPDSRRSGRRCCRSRRRGGTDRPIHTTNAVRRRSQLLSKRQSMD